MAHVRGAFAVLIGNQDCKSTLIGSIQRTEIFMADLIRVILSVILPPLGVFFQVGLGLQFWINILLTLLGYIPGVVHAIWIIARK